MLNTRQQNLLKLIIENYIDTAEPIGSNFLVENTELEFSGATIRNEMRELEELGYLTHPHTSAGRIPTENGYRHYLDQTFKPVKPTKKQEAELDKTTSSDVEYKEKIKSVAKLVSEWAEAAVIVAFTEKNLYYTGITALFSQPEFRDYAHTIKISNVFDQCEDKIDELYEIVDSNRVKVLIGKENPLGTACGLISVRLNKNDIFCILGPMRMNYAKGVGLAEKIGQINEFKNNV